MTYREVNEMNRCACCGKLLPTGEIRAIRFGREVEFCSSKCERVFDDYKVPKYGEGALEGIPRVVNY